MHSRSNCLEEIHMLIAFHRHTIRQRCRLCTRTPYMKNSCFSHSDKLDCKILRICSDVLYQIMYRYAPVFQCCIPTVLCNRMQSDEETLRKRLWILFVLPFWHKNPSSRSLNRYRTYLAAALFGYFSLGLVSGMDPDSQNGIPYYMYCILKKKQQIILYKFSWKKDQIRIRPDPDPQH